MPGSSIPQKRTESTPTQHNHAELKVYSELARAAVARGQAAALRVWTAVRSIDREGCGIVSRADLRKFQSVFAVTNADLRYAGLESAGTFFTIYPNRVEYRSLQAVCTALGVVPGRVHELKPADLRTVGSFKAACYEAWLSGEELKQISRAELMRLWGHGEDTLRRWERRRGITVIANVVEVQPEHWGTEAEPGPAWARVPRDDRPSREGEIYAWQGENGVMLYRTVNSYRGHAGRLPRGMARKAARAVNAARRSEGAHYGGATKDVGHVFYNWAKLPKVRQMTPGHCLRSTEKTTATDRHIYATWRFSVLRPVTKAFALWQG